MLLPTYFMFKKLAFAARISRPLSSHLVIIHPCYQRIATMAAAAASRRRDPNTLSNYEHFTTTHTRIQLAIDFAAQTLACNVKLSLRSTNDSGQQEIILDTSYLSILDVSLNDQPCEWQLAPRTEPFGSPLVIKLGQAIKDGNSVDVDVSEAW